MIIGNRQGGTPQPDHFIKFTPASFEYWLNGDASAGISYDPIPGGVWMHHCVVKAGTSLAYYRNGVQAGTSTVTKSMGENPFYLGGDVIGERWRGWLSDVRLYNCALPVDAVKALAGTSNAEPNLVGWWKLDETSGIIAADSSASANNGILYGGPTWSAGKVGGALEFDGVDDYVELPIGPLVASLTSCTLSGWVNFSNAGGPWQRIFDFGTGTDSHMFLAARTGDHRADGLHPPAEGQLHHAGVHFEREPAQWLASRRRDG